MSSYCDDVVLGSSSGLRQDVVSFSERSVRRDGNNGCSTRILKLLTVIIRDSNLCELLVSEDSWKPRLASLRPERRDLQDG